MKRYRFTRLLPFASGEIVLVVGVTRLSDGQIVPFGTCTTQTRARSRACIWKDGRPTALEDLPGYGRASIHQYVGPELCVGHCSEHIAAEERGAAVLWTSGVAEELQPIDGYDSAVARAVNAKGLIVGESYASKVPLERKATLWFAGSAVSKHPPIERYPSSEIRSINQSGTAVGKVSNGDRSSAACVWKGKHCFTLDIGGYTQGGAYRITDSDLVIGQIGRNDSGFSALWQLRFDTEARPQPPFTEVKLPAPQRAVAAPPVIDHSDKIRVVINAMLVGGVRAGEPAPYLLEAQTLEELAAVQPVDLNKALMLPMPWDRLESIVAITAGGAMVGHARYGREESAVLITCEE